VSGELKQYAWAMPLVFVLLLAYFLAKITNVYIASLLEIPRSIAVAPGDVASAPPGPLGALADYDPIIKRNIFDSANMVPTQCEENDPRPECQNTEEPETVDSTPTPTPSGVAVKTGLDIHLLSTLVVGEGRDPRSSANVQSNGTLGVYAANDKKGKPFAPGVVLVQIKPKRIEFLNNGRLEYAEITDDAGPDFFVPPDKMAKGSAPAPEKKDEKAPGDQITPVGPNKFVISQAEIDAALSNIGQLYTEIRAVPNLNNGRVEGMKILSIKPGSIFAKLGINRGDVLDRINGQTIDLQNGLQLFNQLKEQKQFSLDVQRMGKPETLQYEIR